MDVFIKNIGPSVNEHELKRAIAEVLHDLDFSWMQALPINFSVLIHRQPRVGQLRSGIFTVPTKQIGQRFLSVCHISHNVINLDGYTLKFSAGRHQPRPEVVEAITRLPYVDPQALEERETIVAELHERYVEVLKIQFGWECRDGSFSPEWEKRCFGELRFDLDKREYRITYGDRIISMRSTQVTWTAEGVEENESSPCCYFHLQYPPTFESDTSLNGSDLRHRRSALEESHVPVAPYTSLAMRLVCTGANAVEDLKWIAGLAHVKHDNNLPPVAHRSLFSATLRDQFDDFVAELEWDVAFQVDALVRNLRMDLSEILYLRPYISRMVKEKGVSYASAFLQQLGVEAKDGVWHQLRPDEDPISKMWLSCKKTLGSYEASEDTVEATDIFMCLHVAVTPTRTYLDGPLPDKSNRVLRQYAEHASNFLRIRFVDENDNIYRLDREVDDRDFIHRRFGDVLLNGLDIAGRHFEFLAYSQSGLKQHAVWFMVPFTKLINGRDVQVTPEYIINSLGSFHGIEYDPDLVHCPARYGARISQAFTATEAAVELEVEEIIILDDIYDASGARSFTDGVGTMSSEFAKYMWSCLQAVSRRHAQNQRIEYPPAMQIRCQGSKGMLSVDYTLQGRQLCLRRSMIKFEAPHSRHVEIVTAFTSPGKFYLNRPLVMMLQDLKIRGGYDILKYLQDKVVKHTEAAKSEMHYAASLLERYGLGASFKLTSVFSHLHKLGVGLRDSSLYRTLIDFAVHHVLRELKYHARIPVPKGYTLPGVADIHGWLKEGQIFACIAPNDGSEPLYLEGSVMIFRSPTIHPGDIQIVEAIGRPPRGCPFHRERLANTVVFSTKGERPLASCLAGGDLDGDVFVCSTMEELLPTILYTPADYHQAPRKTVDWTSTQRDVADFVTEFFYSDNVGIIANNWLLKVDQSDLGICDPECLTLAKLHSDAVDYPKTGQPVSLQDIPRLKGYIKPDWSCPELHAEDRARLYYESQRWLGRLFREIKLPEPRVARHSYLPNGRDVTSAQVFTCFKDTQFFSSRSDSVFKLIKQRVREFIPLWENADPQIHDARGCFLDFSAQFRTICATFSHSSRSPFLTEEEAIVGTIVAKTTAPRKRRDLTSQLREQTSRLFDRIASKIEGEWVEGEESYIVHFQATLRRAWVAYCMSIIYHHSRYFGSRAFGLLALSELFDAIKKLEDAARYHVV